MRPVFTLLLSFFALTCMAQQKLHYTIYFDFDKDVLTTTAARQLADITTTIQTLPIKEIQVSGFTDKSGTDAYDMELSNRRADVVVQSLGEHLQGSYKIGKAYYGKDSLLTLENNAQGKNRRVEIYVMVKPAEVKVQQPAEMQETTQTLTPFYEDVEKQTFTVNLDDTVVIRGKDGTMLKISPGSIQTKTGIPAKGTALVELKEYYKPGDIILAGLHTVADSGLLQTGGMFYFTVMQHGDTTAAATKKPVEMRMPVMDKEMDGMGVFAMHTNTDSAIWDNVGRQFKKMLSYWDWPLSVGKLEDVGMRTDRFESWVIGGSDERNYRDFEPAITIWPGIGLGSTTYTRKIDEVITKIDSVTLRAKEHITFRNKGYRAFGTRHFDTTFLVKYRKAEYSGFTSNLNWINCDRFLKNKNVTDFYVSTPHFKGASIIVYFKSQHAYMPAYLQGDSYLVYRVPADELVSIVAFGKDGNEFYFGKKEYTIAAKGTAKVELTKLGGDDFKKHISAL